MPFHSPQSSNPGPLGQGNRPAGRFPEEPDNKRPLLGYIKIGVGVLVVAGLAWLIWEWANSTSSVRREIPNVPMLVPLPPPPPPPPEPEKVPEPEPEPEEMVEPEPEPDPTPVEEPLPDDQEPTPSDDQSEAMQIDGEAQAGGDAFNIAAGSGRGMSGSGAGRVGNATYGQYLAYNFQRILREDEATRYLSYRVQVNLWLNEAGQVTRAELLRSSGDPYLDEKLIVALRNAPAPEQRPPKSLTLPLRVSLQGRRPS